MPKLTRRADFRYVVTRSDVAGVTFVSVLSLPQLRTA